MSAEVCILSVDTALGACSVALLAGERILARRHVEMDRGHAEVLAPMVDEAMREAQLPFQALERLAVTIGPGTFTGQRVGLAFMRALKVALNIPCLGVTTLAAMAAEAAAETNAEVVVAAHDARRGEVYCGVYQNDGQVLLPPTLLTWRDAADVVARIAGGRVTMLSGTASGQLLPLLHASMNVRDSEIRQPNAVFVARLAQAMPASDAPPQPLYLRAPDAKLPARPLRPDQ